MENTVIGRVHSIQSLGTVDGPGVRFVVFLQGCPLRCGCCHNPDTWDTSAGTQYTAREIVDKAVRFKEYFGIEGGITLSGGEPLLQPSFVREVFSLCRERGIHTCLDTSGCVLTDEVKEVLALTDRVLLDIKYTDENLYVKYVGCTLDKPLGFLGFLDEKHIPTTLRQVIIPTLNDAEENVRKLKEMAKKRPCVDKIELLPFRKICQVKYDTLGLEFPFAHIAEPTADTMNKLNAVINET